MNKTELTTRDAILKLLSDAEIAKVSTQEAGPLLAVGDEYIDLKHLDQGVLRMQAGTQLSMGDVLPRSAVQAATWSKVSALCTHGPS